VATCYQGHSARSPTWRRSAGDTKEGFVERQALRIRQGEREPVRVFETPGVGPFFPGLGGLCFLLTQTPRSEGGSPAPMVARRTRSSPLMSPLARARR
jgi:hypothetical protein